MFTLMVAISIIVALFVIAEISILAVIVTAFNRADKPYTHKKFH